MCPAVATVAVALPSPAPPSLAQLPTGSLSPPPHPPQQWAEWGKLWSWSSTLKVSHQSPHHKTWEMITNFHSYYEDQASHV